MGYQTERFTRRRFVVGSAAVAAMAHGSWLLGQAAQSKAAFQFQGTDYFFRWTDGKLFEFTPQGQTDLDRWTEMVSVVPYTEVKTAEQLAGAANGLLELYKSDKAVVLKTSSVPMTPDRPAEHFMALMMAGKELVEGIFTRLLLMDGMGYGVVFSHRFYGPSLQDTAQQLGKWEQANGPDAEKALLSFASIPTASVLEHWKSVGLQK